MNPNFPWNLILYGLYTDLLPKLIIFKYTFLKGHNLIVVVEQQPVYHIGHQNTS